MTAMKAASKEVERSPSAKEHDFRRTPDRDSLGRETAFWLLGMLE